MAMQPGERKAALRHGAVTEIARQTGRTLGHVSQVIHGKRRDRKVEVAAARKIGRPVHEVFDPAPDSVGSAA